MKLPPIDIGNIDFKLTIGGLVLNVMYVKFGYFYSSMPEHSHSLGSYELHYIPSGQGVLIAQGNRYQIKPGTLFMTGPDVTHEQITNPNDPMAEYCIFFEILSNDSASMNKHSILRDNILSELLISTPFWFGTDNGGLMKLFEMLADELAHYRIGLHHMATNILEMILIQTIRQYSETHASTSVPLKSLDDSRMVIIENSFLFQYATITLSQLAEMLGLSTRQTERAVQKQYGMSFMEKKKQARMSAASHLLLTTELSVTAIARQIGFTTVEQFSNAFKKFYGMTATQYRKKQV
ncbi:AraC family transcriptional regulator [Gracilibacillus sp. YIM 98692]|uniref:AraC family transcriptional regulator n=1 Tax=Gracilibacillus sp. YIM 98692 TaxID=2663532 RepID=UPI0013D0D7A0|nr:AraC family transcriptional regulator [Gracilibacillus sp. YIM 98692]